MLINDTATVACEVPIWPWEKNLGVGVSGHIDLLQIRWGRIYVLDFKPMAAWENEQRVASQLYLYASGLSFRTGIPLKVFRCAWFDENDYYEFSPVEVEVISVLPSLPSPLLLTNQEQSKHLLLSLLPNLL